MRCTLGTVVGLTAAILMTSAFWPANQGPAVPQNAVAQATDEKKVEAKSEGVPTPDASPAKPHVLTDSKVVTPQRDEMYAHTAEELKKKTTLNFTDTTMREAIEYIAQLHKIPIIYNTKALGDEGIDLDAETISYNLTGIPLATVLDVIFENRNLAYRNWDGILVIESMNSAENNMEVCVYNCRDLLKDVATVQEVVLPTASGEGSSGGGFGGGGGGGFFQVASDAPEKPAPKSKEKSEPAPANCPKIVELTPPQALIKVLMNSVHGPWAENDGNGGTITAFDGMLVVRNNQRAQQGVQNLLDMLRAADRLYVRQTPQSHASQKRLTLEQVPHSEAEHERWRPLEEPTNADLQGMRDQVHGLADDQHSHDTDHEHSDRHSDDSRPAIPVPQKQAVPN